MKELAINGSDLIAAGFAPGKELGEALGKLLELVIEDPGKNVKEVLLQAALSEKKMQ